MWVLIILKHFLKGRWKTNFIKQSILNESGIHLRPEKKSFQILVKKIKTFFDFFETPKLFSRILNFLEEEKKVEKNISFQLEFKFFGGALIEKNHFFNTGGIKNVFHAKNNIF